jgi:nucleotide-binding universal stress UspA family protein
MRILLCTDGSTHGQAALRFGAGLARHSPQPATLLGVLEHPSERDHLARALEDGRRWLVGAPEPETKVRTGHPAEEILDEATPGRYDLVVVGARGQRGFTRFFLGSTSERIARHAQLPVLIVRGEPREVRHMLLCTGGAGPGLDVVRFGGRLALLVGAQATVLHVMSQLPALTPAAAGDLDDLEASALIAEGTREGQHLERALAILDGLDVPAQPLVRHGLVVDEVRDEACQGGYDLIVVGARSTEGLMRWLLKDVGHEILNCCGERPILVVKA